MTNQLSTPISAPAALLLLVTVVGAWVHPVREDES